MMFIEMASYVGDVLSYYIDNQFKESLLSFAFEEKELFTIWLSRWDTNQNYLLQSTTDIDVFQTVPAIIKWNW